MIESERVYWDIVLEGYRSESVNKLIFDSDKSNYTKFTLSEERTRQLLQESHRAYHTQVNDILLTALGYALSELTNDKINYIVLEGHGREEIEAGKRLLGPWAGLLRYIRFGLKLKKI